MDLYGQLLDNKENIDNTNYASKGFFNNYNINNNYIISNKKNHLINNAIKKTKNYKKIKKDKYIYNSQISYDNDDLDLDIELNSISKIIPLDSFYNFEQNNDFNSISNINLNDKEINIKSKIKRT